MSQCDEIFTRLNKKAAENFLRISEERQKSLDWLESYTKDLFSKIAQVQPEKSKVPLLTKTSLTNNRKPNRCTLVSSTDDEENTKSKTENQSINVTENSLNSTRKLRRNASKLAEQKINKQAQIKLNSKLRRPGKDDTVLNDISNNTFNIKSEKKSHSPVKEPIPQIVLKPEPDKVKKEIMLPPAAKPKRGRRKIKEEVNSSDTENEGVVVRVTRSKRTVNTSSSTRSTTAMKSRNSDVILQETAIPIVVIDSDTETVSSQVNSEVENNTVDSKQVTDTPVESDEDDRPLKSRKPKKQTKTIKSNKDEEVAKNLNCTVTLEKNTLNDTHVQKEAKISPLNITHVIQKDAKLSTLNITHIIQKDAKLSTLNTTHVVETTAPNLTDTIVISKDNEAVLKTKSGVTKDCSVLIQKMNEPITLYKNNAIVDQDVVLTPKENRRQWKKADSPVPVDNLITDDDDSIVKATSENEPEPPQKGIKTKQMFSPYANSPVRKRVAAFEKLGTTDSVDAPTRVTRTKTKNQKKDKENLTNFESSRIPTSKSRFITPIANNKLPSLIPQTDSKTYRQGTAANTNISILPTKSASAIKPSRAEEQLRRGEERRKRLEKEEEARKKREALMITKAEEQRKKREEKQLKAQKVREVIGREKEEKLRLVLQERVEEQQKKRELQAKKLAESEERRKIEEITKLLKRREQEKQRQEEKRRRQLALKPPPLPTEDCEDSDSSSQTTSFTKKYLKPEWAQSQNLCQSLIIWRYISKDLIESLWQMEATTPDLQEIFDTEDERILRRNSSAVWQTPPRYSTLPKF